MIQSDFAGYESFGDLGEFGDPRQIEKLMKRAEKRVPDMDLPFRLYGDPISKGHNPFIRDLGHFAAMMDVYSVAETGELPFGDQGFGDFVRVGMADSVSPGLAAFHGFDDGIGPIILEAKDDIGREYNFNAHMFNKKTELSDFDGAYGSLWGKIKKAAKAVDPTRKDSVVRKAARAVDVTNKNSTVRSAARAVDVTNKNSAVRSALRTVDFTNPEAGIRKLLTELDPTSSKSLMNKLIVKYGDFVMFPMGTLVKYGPQIMNCKGTNKEKFECFMQVFLQTVKDQLKNLGPVLEVVGIVVCAFAQQWPMAALMATKFTLKQIILVIKNNKKAAKLVKVLQAMVDAGDLIIMIVAVGFMACLEAPNFYSSVGKILVVLSQPVGDVIMYNSVLIAGAVKYGPTSSEVQKILHDLYIAPIKAAYFAAKGAVTGAVDNAEGAATSLKAGGVALESFGEIFNSMGRSVAKVKKIAFVADVFFGIGRGIAGLKAKLEGFSKAISEGSLSAADQLRTGLLDTINRMEEKGKIKRTEQKPPVQQRKPPVQQKPPTQKPKTEADKIAAKLKPGVTTGKPKSSGVGLLAVVGGAAGLLVGGPIGAVAGAAAGGALGKR